MGLFSRRKKPDERKLTSPPAAPSPQPSPVRARTTSDPHTLQAFDTALGGLIAKTMQMGAHVTKMVDRCGPVFISRNLNAAKEIIQADGEVDKQKDALLAATVEALARHAPVASDLRLILAAEHVGGNLERIADHAKNIAKRTLALNGAALDAGSRDLLARLHRAVCGMLAAALQAFADGNASLAADVLRRDSEPDSLYDDLFHAVIARLQTEKSAAVADVQTLFVGKSLERIGDHATNIAEEVRFLTRGDIPPATRRS